MKKYIHKFYYGSLLTLLYFVIAACNNNFLDRPPLSSVTPQLYLNTEDELATYPLNYYGIFPTDGGWDTGIGEFDNGTDNQATTNANLNLYVPGQWRVPQSGGLSLGVIRACNYFLEQVLPKWKTGEISGDPNNIKQYIGEVYMLRAVANFNFLKTYGDFPIIRHTLPPDQKTLVDVAKRAPQNIFARFIISDLDSAILLMENNVFDRVRLTQDAAKIFESRVALYEASFLTYHQGTPDVPGGQGWPGANMDYNKGFTIDLNTEIPWFLNKAMTVAKDVADRIPLTQNSEITNPVNNKPDGWNSYFEMFGARDMGIYPEIIFWRQYNLSLGITHGVSVYIKNGANTGLTKGFVDAFLMKNGLPIYASGSGYRGDSTIMETKQGRDDRLQLFLAGEQDLRSVGGAVKDTFGYPGITALEEIRDVTGYRSRKFLNYAPDEAPGSGLTCTAGSPIFRAAEAYLNYIEASYMLNHAIDATATKYWQELRQRAGIDPDFWKTINATDMTKETNDWGAYSAGKLVDPILYNIRRERRCEFVSEGIRYADLMRWCSMDQVKNYVIEGFNLWDKAYMAYPTLIDDGSSSANVSNRTLSKYLRPYQKVQANNLVYNGYTWDKANYLAPFSVKEMQLAAPDQTSADKSNLYQNPYWPTTPNDPATE